VPEQGAASILWPNTVHPAPLVKRRPSKFEASLHFPVAVFRIELGHAIHVHIVIKLDWIRMMPDRVQKSTQSERKEANIDARLRQLQAENAWSLQQMADKSGLSKSSLQNYMRKKDPQKPGVDAVISLSSGLKVSADWLLGMSSSRGAQIETAERLSTLELSAKLVIEQMIAVMNVTYAHTKDAEGGSLFRDDKLYGAEPEDLAADYAYRVVKLYTELESGRVSKHRMRVARETDGSSTPMHLDPVKLDLSGKT
jgi:transcriptional regulator with XRE-family HTH domain